MTGGAPAAAPKTPPLKLEKPPEFLANDAAAIQAKAVAGDTTAYGLSDFDFSKRHGGLVQAEKLFEASALDDQKRKDTFTPIQQATSIQSGLANTNSAFGDATGAGLNPSDSNVADAREAGIAKNLGLDLMSVQNQNRQNRMGSLGLAEGLFQRRTFGLGGNELANIDIGNTASLNNYNQANYSTQNQAKQANANIEAGNASNDIAQKNAAAQADAQKKQAAIAAAAAVAMAVAVAF